MDQHVFSGLQSLQQAAPTAGTAADSNSALSCLLFLVTDPEMLFCCIYGVTSDLPVLRPLYAPAASRKKRGESVDVRGQFISRTVHTGRSRDASPQQRFGKTSENVVRRQENQCWLPAIRVTESPSISSSDEELVRERRGVSPPHSIDQIRSNLLF